MTEAACRGKAPSKPGEPDPWFPERGQVEVANEGKVICFNCPVRPQCNDYRRRTGSDWGMWAGEIQKRKKLNGQS